MNTEEIFQLVNDLDIPAELHGNTVTYIEEFDCKGNDHHTFAINLLEARGKQLEQVGLTISKPSLELQTIKGIIISR